VLFAEGVTCWVAGLECKIGALCKVHCEAAVNAGTMCIAI
jgi:hypothetical protein